MREGVKAGSVEYSTNPAFALLVLAHNHWEYNVVPCRNTGGYIHTIRRWRGGIRVHWPIGGQLIVDSCTRDTPRNTPLPSNGNGDHINAFCRIRIGHDQKAKGPRSIALHREGEYKTIDAECYRAVGRIAISRDEENTSRCTIAVVCREGWLTGERGCTWCRGIGLRCGGRR